MCMACQGGSLKAVSAGVMRLCDMALPLAAPDGVPFVVLTSPHSPHVPAHGFSHSLDVFSSGAPGWDRSNAGG